jgi:hypothetical protein
MRPAAESLLYSEEYPTTPFATPRDRFDNLMEEPEYQSLLTEAGMSGQGLPTAAVGSVRKVLPKVQKAVTPPDDPMIVQHNINVEPLERANRIGGLPMPSIAVSKAENPLTDFGDISLLASPEMAKPSAKNPVYGFDAYTVRVPDIEKTPNEDFIKLVNKKFRLGNEYFAESVAKKLISNDFGDYKSNIDDLLRNEFLKTKKQSVKRSDYPDDYKGKLDYQEEIRKRIPSAEFRDWVLSKRNKILQEGGGVNERILQRITDNGRVYSSATLPNIVKKMRSVEKEQGDVGIDSFGGGNLRSKVGKRFKSFSEIKGERDKIISTEEFDILREKSDQKIIDFQKSVEDYIADNFPSSSGYRNYNTIEGLSEDLITGRSFKDWFPHSVPDQLKTKAQELRTELREMPTEYFEIKPKRGVELSEFEGAIIPKDVSKKVKPLLKKAGIRKILEYGSEEERKALFKKFPELMFALPLISAGLLGSQQETGQESLLYD